MVNFDQCATENRSAVNLLIIITNSKLNHVIVLQPLQKHVCTVSAATVYFLALNDHPLRVFGKSKMQS